MVAINELTNFMRPPFPGPDVNQLAQCEASLKLNDWGMDAAEAARIFEHEWRAELSSANAGASLKKALWRSFRGQFLLASLLKLAWGACVLTSVTYFVGALLVYVSSRALDTDHTPEEGRVGIGYAIGFLVCMMLQSLAMQQMTIVSARLGLRGCVCVCVCV